ncbi:MFS transporter [Desulfosporosinus sp. PR]|uniref:MFS transporter n=1 Tax=Candidatus Desulfosporosinus nitrosoreducens TaxID=3401928 RepID=UPI0027E8B7F3|nr:MFS transporter [Desulfosporosinus sp. PR]MDQ7096477.1 MFS transporter [Desulfosporosinus sp. PR]
MWLRIYLYGLFQALIVDNFLWFIYLLHLGYSAALIGLGSAVYSLTLVLFNIPSSWIADRLKKRTVLFVASIAKTLSSLCFLFGGLGFGLILAGFITAGIATALPTGVDLTYLKDIVNQNSASHYSSELFRLKLSRFVTMQSVALLVAGVLGGILSAWSFDVLYLADVLVGVMTMVLVWSLPMPRRDGVCTKSRRAKKLIVWRSYFEALSVLVNGTVVFRRLAAVAIGVGVLSAALNTYSQGLLSSEGLRTAVIPLIFAITTLPAVAGSWFAGMFRTQGSQKKGIMVLTWLYALSGIVCALNLPSASGTIFLSAGGIAVGQLGRGLSSVLFNEQLLGHAPEKSRSLALSMVSTIQTLMMIVVSPLCGFLATQAGFHLIFMISAIVFAIMAMTFRSLGFEL